MLSLQDLITANEAHAARMRPWPEGEPSPASTVGLNARPHINGNTAGDFRGAALDVENLLAIAERVLGGVAGEIAHGRNYQHMSPADARRAREIDIMRIGDRRSAITGMLKTISRELQHAAGEP